MNKYNFLMYYDYGSLFYDQIVKVGYSICIITENESENEIAKNNSWNYININEYIEKFKKQEGIDTSFELERMAKKFKFNQFRRAIFTTHYFSNWLGEDELLKKLCYNLLAWEYIFEKKLSCEYFLRLGGEFLELYSAKIVINSYCKIIYFGNFIVFNRIQFSVDFSGRWIIKPYPVFIESEEKRYLINYIKATIEKREVISHGSEIISKKIKLRYLFGFLKKLKLLFKKPLGYDYVNNPFWLVRDILYRNIREKIYKVFYSESDIDYPYIYFPLHTTFDSALTAIGEPFLYQYNLIELIHRYLPYGYKIVIKEHPLEQGIIPFNQFRKISRLKDAIILNPNKNSHDIIKNSKMVTVICSSVGFEAILHKKPVITFADTYYTNQGVTIDVRNLLTLSKEITEGLDFVPNDSAILNMMVRVYRETYPINAKKLFKRDAEIIETFVISLLDFTSKLEK